MSNVPALPFMVTVDVPALNVRVPLAGKVIDPNVTELLPKLIVLV